MGNVVNLIGTKVLRYLIKHYPRCACEGVFCIKLTFELVHGGKQIVLPDVSGLCPVS
jgi:hypothetical protein